jgi:hypothetical protein
MVSLDMGTLLRRLMAAMLAVSIAVPMSALAGGGCTMDVPMLSAERCDCCTGSMPAAPGHCGGAPMAQSGCGCTLRADTGSEPRTIAATAPSSVHFAIDEARIAASLSTPQPASRIVAMAASPPGAGALVSLPTLCTWII